MEMKLEVVALPVADVDVAKAFYTERVGFHLDHDVRPNDSMRVVQMTPPGSACSVVIGQGLPLGEPGSVKGVQLVVEVLDDELNSLRSEEHTSELQSRRELVCRLLLEKKNGQLFIHPASSDAIQPHYMAPKNCD